MLSSGLGIPKPRGAPPRNLEEEIMLRTEADACVGNTRTRLQGTHFRNRKKAGDRRSCSWSIETGGAVADLQLHLRRVCPPRLIGIHHHAHLQHPLNPWWDAVKGTGIMEGPPAVFRLSVLLSGQGESPPAVGSVPEARSGLTPVEGLLIRTLLILKPVGNFESAQRREFCVIYGI